ncbi:MAG: hypothetical protein HY262_06905 [Chloroflexi bacterium]|nr:hypothetical protein [Chloroflexota bacterium]
MELLSVSLIGAMVGAVFLLRLPVGECDQCVHCLTERSEAERKRQDEHHRQVHGLYAEGHCPICRPDA